MTRLRPFPDPGESRSTVSKRPSILGLRRLIFVIDDAAPGRIQAFPAAVETVSGTINFHGRRLVRSCACVDALLAIAF